MRYCSFWQSVLCGEQTGKENHKARKETMSKLNGLDATDKLYLAQAAKAGLPYDQMERKVKQWKRKARQDNAFVQNAIKLNGD